MTWEKFDADIKQIASTFSVTEGHACCYLCNFGDEYICYEHDGGCNRVEECQSIHDRLPYLCKGITL